VPSAQLLEWDSEFWGVRIARVDSPDVDEWVRENDVACTYLLVPSADAAAAQRAEDGGFRLMDVRVELDAPTARSEQPVREHSGEDVDRLAALARHNHADTRFYADPNFPRDACDRFYETWIRNSCAGWADAVLVTDVDGEPSGYVSVHDRAGVGSIGLIGVDPDSRGRGLGEALVRGALDWCARTGLERCTVVTQGRNVGGQRVFQRCGFRTMSVALWFHKWWRT
jgi:GNAT superfamily N-acetyltransferase